MRSLRLSRFPVLALGGLALAIGLAWTPRVARASDAHAEPAPAKAAPKEPGHEPAKPAPAARPSAKAEPKADAHGAAEADLDSLRERLNAKLNDSRARGDRSPVLRVANSGHGTADGHGAAKAPPRRAAAAKTAAAAAPPAAEHGAGAHVHWSYGGEGGPAQWAGLKPEFATCGLGARQSPIDIRGGIRVDLEPIRFDYRPSAFSVLDNGHTVQANIAGSNSIEIGGRRYDLLQFHFHRPSEERINGRQYDMVIHLVHKDPEGRLAVVAVMLEQGRAQPAIQMVWNSLPLEKNLENPAPVPLDLNLLLPEDRRYFTYMGSLTTPPCSEGVLWMVMKQPVPVSPDQVGVFARLYPMKARPIQPSAGRLIKESN